ncbi:MAG: CBS domain-containing protein [Methanobacteriaceae archaeon]|nr:CBS domain-containing protein [Methanobacteriaceae archaeon]
MKVKEVMNPNIYTIEIDETPTTAFKKMYELGIRRLFIFNKDEKPIGILSYYDIMTLLATLESKEETDKTTIKEIMTEEINTINQNEDIQSAANLMLRADISGLLVINDNNVAVGVITKTDLCRLISISNITPL